MPLHSPPTQQSPTSPPNLPEIAQKQHRPHLRLLESVFVKQNQHGTCAGGPCASRKSVRVNQKQVNTTSSRPSQALHSPSRRRIRIIGVYCVKLDLFHAQARRQALSCAPAQPSTSARPDIPTKTPWEIAQKQHRPRLRLLESVFVTKKTAGQRCRWSLWY